MSSASFYVHGITNNGAHYPPPIRGDGRRSRSSKAQDYSQPNYASPRSYTERLAHIASQVNPSSPLAAHPSQMAPVVASGGVPVPPSPDVWGQEARTTTNCWQQQQQQRQPRRRRRRQPKLPDWLFVAQAVVATFVQPLLTLALCVMVGILCTRLTRLHAY